MPQEAGILLRDQIFTFTPGGADDGAFGATTPVVTDLKIDKATLRQMNELSDVSVAMEVDEFMRALRGDWEATFETKLDRGFIRDLAMTLTPGGAELDYTAGSALTTLEVNSVRLRQTNELVQTYTGQAGVAKYRQRKGPWTVNVETTKEKLASTGFGNLLKNNALVAFDFVHAPTNQSVFECEGTGRVEEWVTNFEDVGTQSFSLRPHGAPFTLTHDDANSMMSMLIANALIQAAMLDDITTTAADFTVQGIVSFIEVVFAAAATTYSFGLRPYGAGATVGFS